MESLFDELERKLAQDPSMLKRGGPRVDLSLLLFNARAEVRALWLAAAAATEVSAAPALAAAVDALRPIFGAARSGAARPRRCASASALAVAGRLAVAARGSGRRHGAPVPAQSHSTPGAPPVSAARSASVSARLRPSAPIAT
jgi:hypothetical protein